MRPSGDKIADSETKNMTILQKGEISELAVIASCLRENEKIYKRSL